MLDKLSTGLRDLLNRVVSDRIDDFTLETEESELKGDNFLGEILFFFLRNKKTGDQLHFVVKQSLEAMKARQELNNVYANEIKFYEKVWPTLDKYQKASSVGFDKIAKYYGHVDENGVDKLVLEDLRNGQYKLYDKTIPVDDEHYRLIFKTYGVFHAISYAFRQQNREEFLELREGLSGMGEIMLTWNGLEDILRLHLKVVKELFEGDEGINRSIDEHWGDPVKKFIKEESYTGDVPVLTHGDCWSNNMMFKYNDKGEVMDLRLLDFQLTDVSSPVYDLSYALYSGASKKILDNLDSYLELYLDKFTETLTKLNCKPERTCTLDTLRDEWKKYCTFGFYMGLVLWRMKLVDKDHIPTVADEDTSELTPVAKDKVDLYEKMVKDLVAHVYENGFL